MTYSKFRSVGKDRMVEIPQEERDHRAGLGQRPSQHQNLRHLPGPSRGDVRVGYDPRNDSAHVFKTSMSLPLPREAVFTFLPMRPTWNASRPQSSCSAPGCYLDRR